MGYFLILLLMAASCGAAEDVHGVCDVVFKNDYVTPRGLLVTDTGLTVQVLAGVELEVCKGVSVNFGIWNDLWTEQGNPHVGSWNELDWFVGTEITRGDFKFRAQFIEFVSPPGNFKPENNAEFTLFYDDKGKCVTFNPYVRLFWAISGDSTVVVGRRGKTYYVELGVTPTYRLSSRIKISAPTWLSVGPAHFWNGGKLAIKSEKSHFGVVSTGLKSEIELSFIPERLGKWYFDFGFQYYYLINRNLLQAQLFTLNLPSIHSAKRSVWVGFAGIGFNY